MAHRAVVINAKLSITPSPCNIIASMTRRSVSSMMSMLPVTERSLGYCGKVYIVSPLIDKKGRKCPACGLSKGFITASQSKNGKAWIEWPTTPEPHRYIVKVRVEPSEDHPGETVTIVTTNLNVNRESSNYNAAAMVELTKHVEAWQAEHVRMVTIEGPV